MNDIDILENISKAFISDQTGNRCELCKTTFTTIRSSTGKMFMKCPECGTFVLLFPNERDRDLLFSFRKQVENIMLVARRKYGDEWFLKWYKDEVKKLYETIDVGGPNGKSDDL